MDVSMDDQIDTSQSPLVPLGQCALCFVSLGVNRGEDINCGNPQCSNKICRDCLEHLIQYSSNNKALPCCPVQACREIYLYSEIQTINPPNQNIASDYKKACFDFFLKSDGDSIKKQILEQEIIDKIRAEKLQFLENSFPPAVGLVARIAFKQKLHKITQMKKELVHLKIKLNQKKCFFQTCTGLLDDGIYDDDESDSNRENNNKQNGLVQNVLVCLLCESRFCKLCEKELELYNNKEKHKCNEDDVESLNLVHGMTRCPGCNLPVFKDVGCDFITCSSCSVSFHYKTGERTNHGSVNAKIQLAPEQRMLSVLYRNELSDSCLKLMLTIESLRPPVVSKNIIMRPIHRSIKNSNSRRYERDLVVSLEKYTRYKYDSKTYIRVLGKIEKQFQKGFIKEKRELTVLVGSLETAIDPSTKIFLKDALDEICSEK